jgi:hypothetical protein
MRNKIHDFIVLIVIIIFLLGAAGNVWGKDDFLSELINNYRQKDYQKVINQINNYPVSGGKPQCKTNHQDDPLTYNSGSKFFSYRLNFPDVDISLTIKSNIQGFQRKEENSNQFDLKIL